MGLHGRLPGVALRVALGLAVVAVLEGLLSASWFGVDPLDGGFQRWVYSVVIAASALLLVARVLLVREARLAWGFLAVGLSLWAIGDLYYTLLDDTPGAGSHPSAADLLFVACYPFCTVGLVALARDNLGRRTSLILLDGLTAALATTSLALALFAGPAMKLTEAGMSAYAPTIAYPVCDFLLVAFAVGMVTMSGTPWRRMWLLIAVGWGLTSVADTLHVFDAVVGGYSLGGSYDFMWPLATVCLAAAGWQQVGRAPATPLRLGPMFAFPSLFALPALAVLVIDHFSPIGLLSLVLAAATIILVFARVGIALKELGDAHDEQLRVRERSAQSRRLAALGQLAGGVAHDFNNLLAVILNYSHFLTESLPKGDPRREDALEIQRTGERAAELAQQLLLFSRRDMAAPKLVHIGPSLAAMDKMLRTTVSERVQLSTFAAGDLPPVTLGPGQLEQIVLNLVVNARDAMPSGGRLSILAEPLRLTGESSELPLPEGDYVRVTVRDSGEGMSERVLERAFEPFFSTKAAGQGTGLGLATVYGIVEHAGGAVDIRSREGAGTSVLVYLPAAPGSVDVEPVAAGEVEPEGHGERILLVEDEPALRRSTARILTAQGYQVIEAADGEEALSLAASEPDGVDLLVTDVVMPNLSGADLARSLQVEERDVPVIFISGYPADVLSAEGLLDAPGTLLLKPLAAPELACAVQAALHSPGGLPQKERSL